MKISIGDNNEINKSNFIENRQIDNRPKQSLIESIGVNIISNVIWWILSVTVIAIIAGVKIFVL